VPELEGVQGGAVHEPWKLEPLLRRGLDYPDPIVNQSIPSPLRGG
jgi:deoxyribodipyrimidine photo-lyase